jgi:hypothetical protein
MPALRIAAKARQVNSRTLQPLRGRWLRLRGVVLPLKLPWLLHARWLALLAGRASRSRCDHPARRRACQPGKEITPSYDVHSPIGGIVRTYAMGRWVAWYTSYVSRTYVRLFRGPLFRWLVLNRLHSGWYRATLRWLHRLSPRAKASGSANGRRHHGTTSDDFEPGRAQWAEFDPFETHANDRGAGASVSIP